ncbi:MAG: oxidoreductase [Bacteroidota bacterium]
MEKIQMKTAIIAGASGLIGKQLLYNLIEAGEYEMVIALVRKELPIASPKLKQVITDFDDLTMVQHLLKANDVFCCLGTTIKKAGSQAEFRKVDYKYCYQLAKETYKQGSQNFYLVSALGANPLSTIFYNRVKGETEEAIKHIAFNSFYVFRPSLLLGDRREFRLGEKLAQVVMKPFSLFMLGGLKKYKPIEASVIAKAMYKVAQKNAKGVIIIENEAIPSYA